MNYDDYQKFTRDVKNYLQMECSLDSFNINPKKINVIVEPNAHSTQTSDVILEFNDNNSFCTPQINEHKIRRIGMTHNTHINQIKFRAKQ